MGSGGRSCIENGVIEIKRRSEEKGLSVKLKVNRSGVCGVWLRVE